MNSRVDVLERRLERAERRFRVMCGLALAVVCGAVLVESRPTAHADQGGGLPALDARVSALETKTAPLKLIPAEDLFAVPEVVFSGVNVRIINGMGSTETTNGAGNLIVGYNEDQNAEGIGPRKHTGSHNIIVGEGNYFSSYGGIVAGQMNAIHGPFASVLCGSFNMASGSYSSVSGGYAGKATEYAASVTGGFQNHATGSACTVCGGFSCTAAEGDGVNGTAVCAGGYGAYAAGDFAFTAGTAGDRTVHGNFVSP